MVSIIIIFDANLYNIYIVSIMFACVQKTAYHTCVKLMVDEMALGGRQSDKISQLELLKLLKLRKIVNCYEQVFNWSSKEIDTIGPRQTGHNSFSTSRGEEVGLYY